MFEDIFVGIDPGKTGALACVIVPSIKIKDKTKEKELRRNPIQYTQEKPTILVFDFDSTHALTFLRSLHMKIKKGTMVIAIIEKAQAMRFGEKPQGTVSTGKFMENYGIWKGRLEALDIPFEEVSPKTWKKEMFGVTKKMKGKKKDKKKMKEESLVLARKMFPNKKEILSRSKDHNRAEALLLAAYGRNKYYGTTT